MSDLFNEIKKNNTQEMTTELFKLSLEMPNSHLRDRLDYIIQNFVIILREEKINENKNKYSTKSEEGLKEHKYIMGAMESYMDIVSKIRSGSKIEEILNYSENKFIEYANKSDKIFDELIEYIKNK